MLHTTRDPAIEHALERLGGDGRYRLEFRDERRWIVAVKTVVVDPTGALAAARQRETIRAVPAPRPIPSTPFTEPLIARSSNLDLAPPTVVPAAALPPPPSNRTSVAAAREWATAVLARVETALTRTANWLATPIPQLTAADAAHLGRIQQRLTAHGAEFWARKVDLHQRATPVGLSAWIEELHTWATGVLQQSDRRIRWLRSRHPKKPITHGGAKPRRHG